MGWLAHSGDGFARYPPILGKIYFGRCVLGRIEIIPSLQFKHQFPCHSIDHLTHFPPPITARRSAGLPPSGSLTCVVQPAAARMPRAVLIASGWESSVRTSPSVSTTAPRPDE